MQAPGRPGAGGPVLPASLGNAPRRELRPPRGSGREPRPSAKRPPRPPAASPIPLVPPGSCFSNQCPSWGEEGLSVGLRGAGEAQEAVTYGRLRPRQAVGPAALGTPTPAPTAPERRRTVWGSLPVPPVSDRPRVGETNAKAEAVNAEAPFAPSAPPASGRVGLCAPPRGAGAVPSLGGRQRERQSQRDPEATRKAELHTDGDRQGLPGALTGTWASCMSPLRCSHR